MRLGPLVMLLKKASQRNSTFVASISAAKRPTFSLNSLLPRKKVRIKVSRAKAAEGRRAANSFISPNPFAARAINQNKRGGCPNRLHCSGGG